MENFNVNLTITDICCNKCCQSINEKTLSIFDTTTIISLQDSFSLRILSVTNTRVTIELTSICLPNSECCNRHIVKIKINNIATN